MPNDRVGLFVYGTLRSQNLAHSLLGDDCEHVTTCRVPGTMVSVGGKYPGAYFGLNAPVPQGCTVLGDVYDIALERIPGIDRYEGAPRLYQRVCINIPGRGSVIAYEFQPLASLFLPVPSGDWFTHERGIT